MMNLVRRSPLKILDSDHCIAILRGQLDLRLWVQPNDILAVTTISVGELTHGAYKSFNPARSMARVDVLMATMSILPFENQAARQFGWLKAYLEKAGMKLPTADLQIAAIALTQGIPLATHNQKHFKRIPKLLLEDWMI